MTQTSLSKIDWTKANDEQLKTIMLHEKECPLPLLEGAFIEAVNRGLFKGFIIHILKKRFRTLSNAEFFMKMPLDDILQYCHLRAVMGMEGFKKNGENFSTYMYTSISSGITEHQRKLDQQKRQGKETSIDKQISDDGDTFHWYLQDHTTNVEKIVIDKLMLEEKLSVLSQVQREVFMMFFKGYNSTEISEILNVNLNTVNTRLRLAKEKLLGKNVNFKQMGVTTRVRKGA